MYKVRFHLKTGKHFKHWQVIELNAKLINKPSVADKIYAGGHKAVCTWCLCELFSFGNKIFRSK